MAKKKTWRNIFIGAGILIVLLTIAKMAGWLGDSNATEVAVDKVSKRSIIETVSANGKVQPEIEVKISADVSGEIVALPIKEGQQVKKGMLLCRIDPEIYISGLDRMAASVNASRANLQSSRSRLAQSQSQFIKSEATYNRNKTLFENNVISKSDWEAVSSAYEVSKAEVDAAKQAVAAAEFNVRSSEASLKEARENLNKTSIYAPVDGTISRLNVEQGERVQGISGLQGTELMRIANLNEMEVSVDVSENDIVRVSLNDTAVIDIDAYLDKKFRGIVTEVANSANVSGVSADQVINFTVKIRILKESYADLIKNAHASPFRPGMSATVEIQTNRVENVLALPIQAVTTRDTVKSFRPQKKDDEEVTADTDELIECVFTIHEGKAKMVPVKTGIQDSRYIEMISGVQSGQEVIVAPFNAVSKTLKDGASVKVVTAEKLYEAEKEKE
jgi:HlyD family secretion protein